MDNAFIKKWLIQIMVVHAILIVFVIFMIVFTDFHHYWVASIFTSIWLVQHTFKLNKHSGGAVTNWKEFWQATKRFGKEID